MLTSGLPFSTNYLYLVLLTTNDIWMEFFSCYLTVYTYVHCEMC